MKKIAEIKAKTLIAASLFAGKNDVRYFLNSVHIDRLGIEATDGHRLIKISRHHESIDYLDNDDNYDLVIPLETIEIIRKQFGSKKGLDTVLHVMHDENDPHNITIDCIGSSIKSKLIDAKYPNTSIVFDKFKQKSQEKIALNPEYLGALNKALTMLNGGKILFSPMLLGDDMLRLDPDKAPNIEAIIMLARV